MTTKTKSTMNVTKTTIINEAEKVTANAKYLINYTCVGNTLQALFATIFDEIEREYPSADGSGTIKQKENVRIGELRMENSQFNTSNLLYDNKIPLYMADFVEIVNEIIAPVTPV